jgi:hypothetical protein
MAHKVDMNADSSQEFSFVTSYPSDEEGKH